MIVYGYPETRSVRIVWLLEELGLEYEYQAIDLIRGEARREPYLSINPQGKVPALKTDQGIICESLAIMNYLCSMKPEPGLMPNESAYQRALYDQWSVYAVTELEQPLWTMAKHKFVLPKEYRVNEVLPAAEYEFQKALLSLSKGLADREYILGPRFSAVDILLGQCLMWGMSFGQRIEQESIQAYVKRLVERPALVRAREKEKKAME